MARGLRPVNRAVVPARGSKRPSDGFNQVTTLVYEANGSFAGLMTNRQSYAPSIQIGFSFAMLSHKKALNSSANRLAQ